MRARHTPHACAPPTPPHPTTTRFMLVIDGQIEIDVNDKEVVVGADSFAYLPPASEEYMSQR